MGEDKMTSKWEVDSNRISQISMDPILNQKTKNKLISRIEKKMGRMEQLELDGKNTGYYSDI